MSDLKPKEPLLAVILSIILAGLGQVYAGRKKRGIIFFFIPVIYLIIMFLQLLTPLFRVSIYVGHHFIVFTVFGVLFSLDAYFCAKSYNIKHNLIRKKNIPKDILFIIDILLLVFICNPVNLFAYPGRFYIAECVGITRDTMAPIIQKGDKVIVNKFIYRLTEPKRFDVALFRNKADSIIVRIAGLPKDIIEIKNRALSVNGVILRELDSQIFNGDHLNLDKKMTVPLDTYFVLADNFALDTPGSGGFIPKKYLKGKVYKIYYPLSRAGFVK